jgi:hypothetical protein
VQLVNFGIQVQGQLFNSGHYLGIRFPQGLDLMALVVAMDHAFRANRGRQAVEAEVVNLFFWMLLACFTLRPELSRLNGLLEVLLLGLPWRLERHVPLLLRLSDWLWLMQIFLRRDFLGIPGVLVLKVIDWEETQELSG